MSRAFIASTTIGLLLALSSAARAQQPFLVKDINQVIYVQESSYPSSLVAAGDTLFFEAQDPARSAMLWKSDGTWDGTEIVAGTSRYAKHVTNVNGTVFFASYVFEFGQELWKSDGTPAGTEMVKDINPGPADSLPDDPYNPVLTTVNGTLFFRASDGTNGEELWKSDGTPAGTEMVKDINPGPADAFLYSPYNPALTTVNGTLFLRADDGTHGEELWTSDGTAAGTVMVKDIMPGSESSSISDITDVNGTLFFRADDGVHGAELWKSDGTNAGTVMVRDISPGSDASWPSEITAVSGTLFFVADDGTSGAELWTSDGSALGTVMVRDINPGPDGSWPDSIANVNGVVFFTARDGTHGDELWKSDGTAAGTVIVKDINPGPDHSYPFDFTEVGGTLFFDADDGTHGRELWKSHGTAAGTVMVKDINPGVAGSRPSTLRALTEMNGVLFFSADDGTHGAELWKSDGTGAGTLMVRDISFANDSSVPRYLADVNGTVFFGAKDRMENWEPWKSDGTAAGTVMVKEIRPGEEGSLSIHTEFTAANGTVFFSADDGTNGDELWKSDGTSPGTVMVTDIYPGVDGSAPMNLTDVNGSLFFDARDGTSGRELWKSDGTAAGTVMVKDINPGADHSYPNRLTNVNGTLFFTADDGTNGYELWKSDGTAGDTNMVKDINPGSEHSYPEHITNVNGTLFLEADDGTHGDELWKSDGTTAGTVMVKDINPGAGSSLSIYPYLTNVNGTLFFSAYDGTHGEELWKSDGTASGTVMVKDINPASASSAPGDLMAVNGTLFFRAHDGTHGLELWKSDGTASGTVMVKDINPGSASSDPTWLADAKGTLYFVADDGTHGEELWTSDGSAAGTVMVEDTYRGRFGSQPRWLTQAGGLLFFGAGELVTGWELWALPLHSADLVVTKDDGLAELDPGDPVTYTIGATNEGGPDDVVGATLSDVFPPALTGCSWTCVASGGGVCTAGPVAGDISDTVDLSVGSSVTYTATCTLDLGASGTLVNTATIDPPVEVWDPTLADNSASDSTIITGAADLSVSKSNGVTDIVPGTPVTYTIVASNPSGPGDVSGATVSDAFPPELTGCWWTCVGAGGGACHAGSVAGDISDTVSLPVGASVTYTASCALAPQATGSLVNTVTITPPAGVTDSAPGNNGATDVDTILGVDLGDVPDPSYPTLYGNFGARHVIGGPLFLGASVDPEPDGQPTPGADGDDLDGSDDEDGVVFTSAVMAGEQASLVVAASAAGVLNAWIDLDLDGDWGDAGEQVFTDALLTPGVNNLSFPAPADASEGTSFARFRFASMGGLPPTGLAADGEVEDHAVAIERESDLEVVKTDWTDPAVAGLGLRYTLTATNLGPSDASNVTLADALPVGVSFLNAIPGSPTCEEAGGVVTCVLGDSAADGTSDVIITVLVDPAASGSLSNSADGSADESDPTPGNNTAVEDTAVVVPLFADALESGDTSAWTMAVPGYAMRKLALAEPVDDYWTSFRLDENLLRSLGPEPVVLLAGVGGNGTFIFVVEAANEPEGVDICARARLDDGSWVKTDWTILGSGSEWFEVNWRRAIPGLADGHLDVLTDGPAELNLTGLDNASSALHAVAVAEKSGRTAVIDLGVPAHGP